MKITTAGESHGKGVFAVIEGLPAGLRLDLDRINGELSRRQSGFGRGDRQKMEKDCVEILSGVRDLETLGSPLTLAIRNLDYENCRAFMAPEGCSLESARMTKPRPGHCDLAGMQKFGFSDARNVSERASARESAARVAAGTVCRLLLEALGVKITGYVRAVGEVRDPCEYSFEEIETGRSSLLGMMDREKEEAAKALIERARAAGETLGGVLEIRVKGLKSGFGSCMTYEEKLDARLAGALMSVQAVKGVEIGLGFQSAALWGSEAQDALYPQDGKILRKTNRAGGIEGGMSNGEEIVLRAAMKPLPSLKKGLPTVDLETGKPARSEPVRSDVCAVTACETVLESAAAAELCEAVLSRLGGDRMAELIDRYGRLE